MKRQTMNALHKTWVKNITIQKYSYWITGSMMEYHLAALLWPKHTVTENHYFQYSLARKALKTISENGIIEKRKMKIGATVNKWFDCQSTRERLWQREKLGIARRNTNGFELIPISVRHINFDGKWKWNELKRYKYNPKIHQWLWPL